MTTPGEPPRAYPSTSLVQAEALQEQERRRLAQQDELLLAGMGGPLPEQQELSGIKRVLEVNCGTGGWLIALARQSPSIQELVGIESNKALLAYAQEQARLAGVQDRVTFLRQDPRLVLTFSDGRFDLVNQRFGASYLRSWEWPKVLEEFLRLTQPGGRIRLTEAEVQQETSSPALRRLNALLVPALYQAGHFFHARPDGLTSELVPLLEHYGLQEVQSHLWTLTYQAGTPLGELLYQNMQAAFRTLAPFLKKWTQAPPDYEQLYQQALLEARDPQAWGTWRLLTAWGYKPGRPLKRRAPLSVPLKDSQPLEPITPTMKALSAPLKEHPSTYVVQDRDNQEELIRLHIQDQMITRSMGGVLPEQADPTVFGRVLDVGCGTGDWLIEVARTYPSMQRLGGVDISGKMLAFAREQAQLAGVSERVEFVVMDALRVLETPNNTFDLVNHRAGMSWLRTWEWNKLLTEYLRVCTPGGVIRITEGSGFTRSSSPALTRLVDLCIQALYRSGHLFAPDGESVMNELAGLLKRNGVREVQTRRYEMECRAGTPEWQPFFEDMRLGFRTLVPFFRRWLRLPEDYEQLYQQALEEMQQPDFWATGSLLTAWGLAS